MSGCVIDESVDSGPLSIEDFYVVGVDTPASSTNSVIDPYVGNGEFLVFIKLTKPRLGYQLTYYLSNSVSIQDSVPMFSLLCDDDSRSCYDGDYFGVGCHYMPDLTGECDGILFDSRDVIFKLPSAAYIIAQACRVSGADCVTDIADVILR
jgi:hypothetical protein